MAITVKGPFEVKWGDDILADIQTVDVEYDVSTTDIETIQGRRYEVAGTHKVAVSVTFVDDDVAALGVVLPQYLVPNGGTLSTGETVNNAAGAIDVVPGGCSASLVTTDMVITSCGNPGQVLRIPDVTTEIAGITFEDNIRKVIVRFRGTSSTATVQLFTEGAVSIVS